MYPVVDHMAGGTSSWQVTILFVHNLPYYPMHKKWSFLLRIPSVNVTKSAGNCGFGHIYWRNP